MVFTKTRSCTVEDLMLQTVLIGEHEFRWRDLCGLMIDTATNHARETPYPWHISWPKLRCYSTRLHVGNYQLF